MTVTISGTSGVSLCDTNSVPTAALQANAVTQPKVGTGVAGTGPAFSAYQSTLQTLASNTWTKLQLQTKEFDTANCFDNTTNYRFTPNVAGYYQIYAETQVSATASVVVIAIYKNGTLYKQGPQASGAYAFNGSGGCLLYCNGSTDYIEAYAFFSVGQNTVASSSQTFFQGFLVRSA